MGYLLYGALFCLLAGIEDFISILLTYLWMGKAFAFHRKIHETYVSVRNGIDTFKLVKMTLFKIISMGTICKVSWSTKKALDESSKMAGDKAKIILYRRLFGFSLLPLFLNLLYIIPEAMAGKSYDLAKPNCMKRTFFGKRDSKMCTMALIVTMGTFSYKVAYALLFPKVRAAMLCRNGDQVQE